MKIWQLRYIDYEWPAEVQPIEYVQPIENTNQMRDEPAQQQYQPEYYMPIEYFLPITNEEPPPLGYVQPIEYLVQTPESWPNEKSPYQPFDPYNKMKYEPHLNLGPNDPVYELVRDLNWDREMLGFPIAFGVVPEQQKPSSDGSGNPYNYYPYDKVPENYPYYYDNNYPIYWNPSYYVDPRRSENDYVPSQNPGNVAANQNRH